MTSLRQEKRVKIFLFNGKYESIIRVWTEFARFYEISYQPRQVPSYKTIKRVVDRFLNTGSVHVVTSSRHPKAVLTAENRERINQTACSGQKFPPPHFNVEGGHFGHVLKKYKNRALGNKYSKSPSV